MSSGSGPWFRCHKLELEFISLGRIGQGAYGEVYKALMPVSSPVSHAGPSGGSGRVGSPSRRGASSECLDGQFPAQTYPGIVSGSCASLDATEEDGDSAAPGSARRAAGGGGLTGSMQSATSANGGGGAGGGGGDGSGGSVVALKIVPWFNRDPDHAIRVLREVEVLRHFQHLPEVVGMHVAYTCDFADPAGSTQDSSDSIGGSGGGGSGATTIAHVLSATDASGGDNTASSGNGSPAPVFRRDLVIAMDFVEQDMARLIQEHAEFKASMIRSITAQLLVCLYGIHRDGCNHRDLSSKNILISSQALVTVCDFGLSRFYYPDEQQSLGVVTQWYRAPEVITDCNYTCAIDIWSVGVVVAEMHLRDFLFKGRNNDVVDQLNKIMDVLGPIDPAALGEARDYCTASDNARKYIRDCSLPNSRFVLRSACGVRGLPFAVQPTPRAIALMEKMLSLEPSRRGTARELLDDPYFARTGESDLVRDYIELRLREIDARAAVQLPHAKRGLPVTELCSELDVVVSEIQQEYEARKAVAVPATQ